MPAGKALARKLYWPDALREPIHARVEIFSQLLTCANEPELKSRAGSAYRVVKQRKAGAPRPTKMGNIASPWHYDELPGFIQKRAAMAATRLK
jgi:hypothetical protein